MWTFCSGLVWRLTRIGAPECMIHETIRTPSTAFAQPDATQTLGAGMAHATEKVADFTASGFLFKDSVNVIAQEDPQGAPHTQLAHFMCACGSASSELRHNPICSHADRSRHANMQSKA